MPLTCLKARYMSWISFRENFVFLHSSSKLWGGGGNDLCRTWWPPSIDGQLPDSYSAPNCPGRLTDGPADCEPVTGMDTVRIQLPTQLLKSE
ncbi:hypothetical protein AVEN_149666-1 [Araneus ventricosus]|uniref:Uncharacterized protein n=1 Tax=Araneus ventricosus TaxID=182803 RepID=A0A4Y2VCG6_ARAVE|nr:hypothetical protein AVEN_237347-1 [Araneus ventricosus]GBO22939.1 hypothetical protein AVEN_149666-1 [Araneus ventricosus]